MISIYLQSLDSLKFAQRFINFSFDYFIWKIWKPFQTVMQLKQNLLRIGIFEEWLKEDVESEYNEIFIFMLTDFK